ncbi:unnamed protein product, partial [Mesorhabditis belari]|uniref:Glycosyltransferase 2-like domain-containing protein n=1 Tax=Mesorhabditis belari TaxID=2138241 RepID=A0AAF3F7N3_9BILA
MTIVTRGSIRQSSECPAAVHGKHSDRQSHSPFPLEPPYKGRDVKEANEYIRWYILFALLIFISFSSIFWIPAIPFIQNYSMEIFLFFSFLLHLIWFTATLNAFFYTRRLRKFRKHKIKLKPTCESKDWIIKHFVGICIYKEPLQLLIDTIESVANQSEASKKISMFIGIEEGTPEREKKTAELHKLFDSRFERFFVVSHPRGLPGDIPGKCSNLNFAARTGVAYFIKTMQEQNEKLGVNPKTQVLVTTGDCDSVFGERYFDALEEDFWKTKTEDRNRTVWQSPLFYSMRLERSPFFVRVTGLLRSFFMMGFLIPWGINTMSIFSLTLELYRDGDYTHPGYQMEDIIALIRWSLAVRKRCIIRAIPVATLSGPTSGDNYRHEFFEWARQIRRWTIGAAEVFHYFVIKSTRLPRFVSLVFGAKFVFYYGFMLCIAPIYSILGATLTTTMMSLFGVKDGGDGLFSANTHLFTYVNLGLLALQYFWFLCVFLVNMICESVLPPFKDRTSINFFRNVFHWILCLPTILMYCLVELDAFVEVTFRGKAVCSHSASKKDNLVSANDQNKRKPEKLDVETLQIV